MLAGAGAEREGLTGLNSNSLKSIELKEVLFKAPAPLSNSEIIVNLGNPGSKVMCGGRVVVEVANVATSRRRPQDLGSPSVAAEQDCVVDVDMSSFYDRLEKHGVSMGPRFRVLRNVRRNNKTVTADLELPAVDVWEHAMQLPHWSLLDGAFQLLGVLGHNVAGVCVPFSVAECCMGEVPAEGCIPKMRACARLTMAQRGMIKGDITVSSCDGRVVAVFKDFVARSIEGHFKSSLLEHHHLYSLAWRDAHGSSSEVGIPNKVETQEAIDTITAADGTHVLVMHCWLDMGEEQIEQLTVNALTMLKVLQDSAKEKQPHRAIVAGSGGFAETCFSTLTGMLRSAQIEQPVDVQAWSDDGWRPKDHRLDSFSSW